MASIQPPSGGSGRNRTRGGRSKAVTGDSNAQQAAIRLKIVIRHLPSFLKEAEFREEMKDTIKDDTCDYFSWIQGKVSSDHNKTPTPTRCYVRLKSPPQIPVLNAALRAHGPFTDKQGNTTTAQLEYAPFQKVSKKTQRNDTRQNTIESDPDFIAFVASLKGNAPPAAELTADGETPVEPAPLDVNAPAPVPANDPMSVPMPVVEAYEKPTTTPLIEHIRAQKFQPDKNQKGKAVALPEVSKGSRRADRRAREKEMKRKGRETPPVEQRVEPMALLKRADTGPGRLQQQRGQVPPVAPRQERERPSEGERKRGVAAAVATVQKVLGPRSRGARGGAGRANQGGPVVDTKSAASASSSAPSTPVEQTPPHPPTQPAQQAVQQAAQQPPSSPKRTRDRPSRRERRAAKLEREDSSTAAGSPGPSSPKTPVAVLKRQGSSNAPAPAQRHSTAPNPVNRGGPSNAAPTVPMLMKREGSSAAATPAAPAPQRPAQNTATPPRSPMANNTPTGPRGGFRGPMRGPPPARGGGRNPFAPQHNQPSGPPTGPAADMPLGPRGGRGRGGGGGGGRGGGPFRGGPAMRGRAPPPSPGAAAPTGN